MIRSSSFVLCFLLGVARSVHITVYQSPLTYYDTTWTDGGAEWVELTNSSKEVVFTSRFQCQFLTLPFEFPYYSDIITKIGVTKLGFIYTGPYTNARLTELMHIAPLMNLYTFENGTVSQETVLTEEGLSYFVLQWSGVMIGNGSATFQLQLFQNGSIVFAYQNVSMTVLSQSVISVVSAFPWVTTANSVSGDMTYYQYEKIEIENSEVTNSSVLTITRRQNCQDGSNCSTCLDIGTSTEFSCQWCNSLARCSDTFDSKYAQWSDQCSAPTVDDKECQEFNMTAYVLSEEFFAEQILLIAEWMEALVNMSVISYADETCDEGSFYNPYTGSCNDCTYCASDDCEAVCTTADQKQTRNSYDQKNMAVQNFKFNNNRGGADPWKSAFIGMVCGLTVCVCFVLLVVCMKRRSYSQPEGYSWTIARDQGAGVLQDPDNKPLIYGSNHESGGV